MYRRGQKLHVQSAVNIRRFVINLIDNRSELCALWEDCVEGVVVCICLQGTVQCSCRIQFCST